MKTPERVILLSLALAAISAGPPAPARPLVGSLAPKLAVEIWLKGDPVTEFVPGRVYVIDIWAPWCGPCLGGMKHLTELQERNRSRGLTVLGVSGPDEYGSTREGAEKVVAQKGSDIGYSIGWDQDHHMYSTWMALEKASGWPWCFVVDRNGRIAYIGHPERLDANLEKILAGTYDLEKAAASYSRRADGLGKAALFDEAYDEMDWPKAGSLFPQIMQADEEVASAYTVHEYKILAYRMKDAKRAAEFGRRAVATFLHGDRGMLDRLAELILDPKLELDPRDLDLALRCARRADDLADGKNAGAAATLARAYFSRGDREKAIDTQRRALRLADPGDRADFQKTLHSFLAAPRVMTGGGKR